MSQVTRQEVEEFLYEEAALLDAWRLDDWLALLTNDAVYNVPSNDRPDADSRDTLFIIADDIRRIRARVARLTKPDAHAEYPPSRTRRMISNVCRRSFCVRAKCARIARAAARPSRRRSDLRIRACSR